MDTTAKEPAVRLIRQEPSIYNELRQLAETNRELCATISSAILQSDLMYKRLGECIFLLEVLNKTWGRSYLEDWILQNWPHMSSDMRDKISYGAYSPEALSTDFVTHLFLSPASSVRDKHLLLAGLASSAEKRGCDSLVLQLATDLASSVDVAKEPSLEAFLRSVVESFSAAR